MSEQEDKPSGHGIPDSLREAIEGAFAAGGRTRDRATEISEKTLDRAQDLVDQLGRRSHEARDTLEGMRLVARDDLDRVERRIEELTRRVEELERKSGTGPDG